jgi:hypothetical protein
MESIESMCHTEVINYSYVMRYNLLSSSTPKVDEKCNKG